MTKDCLLIYIFCSCCEPEFVQREQQNNSLCKCRKNCTKSLIDPMSNNKLNGANIDPFPWTFSSQVVIAELDSLVTNKPSRLWKQVYTC